MAETPVAAPGPNPLIKTDAAQDESSLEGAGILQDFWDTGAKIASGDWAEGLANLANGAMGLADLVADPIGTLAASAFGWIIEHVPFLREPLDWLVGDQVALDNMIGTWENIGKELESVSEDLGKAVDRESANWTGDAADAYRAFAKNRADLYAGIASGANSIGTLVSVCKMILAVVRTIVRDLISECLGKLISIAMRYPGPAMPAGIAAEGTPKAIGYANKCVGWIKKLTKAFDKAKGLFKRLTDGFDKIKDALTPKALKKFTGGGKKAVDAPGDTTFASKVAEARKDLPESRKHIFGLEGTAKDKSLTENLAQVKENMTGRLKEKYGEDFQSNLVKEKRKAIGKKIDETVGDVLGEEEEPPSKKAPPPAGVMGPYSAAGVPQKSPDPENEAAEPPIFDQQGGQRISGSL
ncbi:WXG100 family type VII secretion target [Amycolatopsis japonica]|uniref:WXG100 family type VII secretion target n=1 Tax=Amycolatopsis japonica TaxID=208439 RepID=UPI003671D1CE